MKRHVSTWNHPMGHQPKHIEIKTTFWLCSRHISVRNICIWNRFVSETSFPLTSILWTHAPFHCRFVISASLFGFFSVVLCLTHARAVFILSISRMTLNGNFFGCFENKNSFSLREKTRPICPKRIMCAFQPKNDENNNLECVQHGTFFGFWPKNKNVSICVDVSMMLSFEFVIGVHIGVRMPSFRTEKLLYHQTRMLNGYRIFNQFIHWTRHMVHKSKATINYYPNPKETTFMKLNLVIIKNEMRRWSEKKKHTPRMSKHFFLSFTMLDTCIIIVAVNAVIQ